MLALSVHCEQGCIAVGCVPPAHYCTGGPRDTDPLCEQNHRHVQKHNLAPTSFSAVIK